MITWSIVEEGDTGVLPREEKSSNVVRGFPRTGVGVVWSGCKDVISREIKPGICPWDSSIETPGRRQCGGGAATAFLVASRFATLEPLGLLNEIYEG